MTPFSNRCEILAALWVDYKSEPAFADFISYNDIGLPLAFLVDQDLAMETDAGRLYIDETFDILLEALGLEDVENGWENLEQLLDESEKRPG